MQLVFLSIVLLLICIVLCVFQNKILFKLKATHGPDLISRHMQNLTNAKGIRTSQ